MKACHMVIPAFLFLVCGGIRVVDGAPADAGQVVQQTGIKAGLCVHLNVTDGKLTADLAKQGKFVVHGIATTQDAAKKAREYISSVDLYGRVSVETGSLSRLPYVTNLVNLVVVDDVESTVKAGLNLEELVRVLCPGGVAYLGRPGDARARLERSAAKGFEVLQSDPTRLLLRKTRPAEMDDWTHWLHSPDGNELSSDSIVGPAAGLRWIDGPIWPSRLPSTAVFDGGRSFCVMEGLGPEPQRALLIARDAYNGLVLWKRQIGSPGMGWRYNPRVVVAVDERVFAVEKEDGPLVAFDAASGEAVKSYDVGISPSVVLYQDGRLILCAEKEICSVNAETGKVRWRSAAPKNATFWYTNERQPRNADAMISTRMPHVVSDNRRLFVFVKDAPEPPYDLVCYDLASGEEKWRKKQLGELTNCYKGALVLVEARSKIGWGQASQGVIHVVSAEDGRKLWEYQHVLRPQRNIPLCFRGLIWINDNRTSRGGMNGFDPATGDRREHFPAPIVGQCSSARVTERYMVCGMSMLFDLKTGKRYSPGCYKNACRVGQIPANGLIYTFPITCSCRAYLRGFLAFTAASAEKKGEAVGEGADRLERGSVYGVKPQRAPADAQPAWNTYRHDTQRSGSTTEALPRDLEVLWSQTITGQVRTEYGKSITAPVVAEGKVFAAAPDAQQLCAVDANTGEVRWRYLLDGRVEAPPTIYRGLCLFGSNNGWVYCLRASDGELVWRFRAAPQERRIMAYGRLESPWPVPAVLVTGGVAYFAAGRHSASDDGIVVYAMEPFTGKVLWEKRVNERTVRTWPNAHVNDVMVSNGRSIFMAQLMFDLKTGESSMTWKKGGKYTEQYIRSGQARDTSAVFPFGFLYDRNDGACMIRYNSTWWAYRGASGLLLAFTGKAVFGVRPVNPGRTTLLTIFGRKFEDAVAAGENLELWSVTVADATVNALLPAGPLVFAAGAEAKPDAKGGMLWVYSADDGSKLGELRFGDAPVFDGMAAAGGRLYVSTQKGEVFCFGRR